MNYKYKVNLSRKINYSSMTKILKYCIIFVLIFSYSIHIVNSEDFKTSDNSMKIRNKNPFILSLILSHGSGLYALNENTKAQPYLFSNIFLIDIPIAILITGIVLNNIRPDIFQGNILTATEYISNSLLITIPISMIVIRIFECRRIKIIEKLNDSNNK